MFVIAGLFGGTVLGALFARQKGGKRLDILQYSAVFAIIGTLLGVFTTIILHRMLIV